MKKETKLNPKKKIWPFLDQNKKSNVNFDFSFFSGLIERGVDIMNFKKHPGHGTKLKS